MVNNYLANIEKNGKNYQIIKQMLHRGIYDARVCRWGIRW